MVPLSKGNLPASRASADDVVFENLPVAGMVVDENKKVLALNREARRIFSGSRTQQLTCRAVAQCEIAPGRCPLVRAFSLQEPIYRTEVHMHTPKGWRSIIEHVSAFHDPRTGMQKAVITFDDETSRKQHLGELRRDAHLDLLTGVYNRNYFEWLFKQLARRAERRSVPAAFLMMDIDGLKTVNDTLGHRRGDDLLARLGRLLKSVVRRSDLLGRLGGDEFGLYCPHTNLSEARQLVNRLRNAIAADNRLHSDTLPLQVGVGLAVSKKGDHQSLRERADKRLYRYKRSRRPEPVPSLSAESLCCSTIRRAPG